MEQKTFKFEEGEVLLFDKPLYWTSFDLVSKVRSLLKYTCGLKKIKVGHAGTLDPLATGLMIICTGKATRRIEDFRDLNKQYIATIKIGETTPSFDQETSVDNTFPYEHITEKQIVEVLRSFVGEQMQEPPLYSAKFVDGKRAYELARKNIDKKLEKVRIVIHDLQLISFTGQEIAVRMLCSKGTYVRAFARDLGEKLNSGAHLISLTRTAIGDYSLDKAVTPDEFKLILNLLKQNSHLNV